jgi:hypothetical protein
MILGTAKLQRRCIIIFSNIGSNINPKSENILNIVGKSKMAEMKNFVQVDGKGGKNTLEFDKEKSNIIVVRYSPISRCWFQMTAPATFEEFRNYKRGELIQFCFPKLSEQEREFIISGFTPSDWESVFGKKGAKA